MSISLLAVTVKCAPELIGLSKRVTTIGGRCHLDETVPEPAIDDALVLTARPAFGAARVARVYRSGLISLGL